MELWSNKNEKEFFTCMLEKVASPEKLFYHLPIGEYAYVPKDQEASGQTLQSRNALIGSYTETWCKKLFTPIAKKYGLFALNTVQCDEVCLPHRSEADLAFCTTNEHCQKAENIRLIFEIKMSIVSNWKYSNNKIECVGDYKTHKGQPSLLRSDSMLKAIGKSINIRVSGEKACHIPIIILGNSPITKGYEHKVDYLKTSGVLQGFWSLNSTLCDDETCIKKTPKDGFITVQNNKMLETLVDSVLTKQLNYFSSMTDTLTLGKIIEVANNEATYKGKATKFLQLIRGL